MKKHVAKHLAKQNWNDVAVDLIEKVKVLSLKIQDYESFFQSEFELINVKKEDIEVKKNRFNLILNKFEESKDKTDQKFTMNNPLIKVYGRFDCRNAEIFDSVTLSIRILSEINFSFNKLYINFNEKSFNTEIYDSDGDVLQLKERETFQNDTTIFVKSHIKSDLVLDCIILEKVEGDHKLSLIIKPTPDIDIDNLIFSSHPKDSDNHEAKQTHDDENKSDIRLKISDTRQKIEFKTDYKKRVFLGEVVPVDFTLKCRPGCEIKDATFELIDSISEIIPDEFVPPSAKMERPSRKSTSIPVAADVEDTSDPFEVASRASQPETDYEIYYVKPSSDDFIQMPIDEGQMDKFPATNLINLVDFDESQDIKCRICFKFFTEGPKYFRIKIKYKIIKIYEDSKSDPIPMTMKHEIKLNCRPPFNVSFDYQVKDWLTNGLNQRDQESDSTSHSFVKIPVGEKVPLFVNVMSISEQPMTIKDISLEIADTRMMEKLSQNVFTQTDELEKNDAVCSSFIMKPLQCANDTGQFADIKIEWFRVNELTGKTFRSICRIPTPSISVVSSPLSVEMSTTDSTFKLCQTFTLEVEVKNTTEIMMDV